VGRQATRSDTPLEPWAGRVDGFDNDVNDPEAPLTYNRDAADGTYCRRHCPIDDCCDGE
jgi:hypothetical protein